MKLSDLQSKDIVTLEGKHVGSIVDVIISDGFIKYIVVEKSKFLLSMFSSSNLLEIKWSQIKTIGEDVILIDLKLD